MINFQIKFVNVTVVFYNLKEILKKNVHFMYSLTECAVNEYF